MLDCCEGRCLTRFSSVFLRGGLAKGLACSGCFDAAVVTTSKQTVDRFSLFFLVAGAALIASADAEDPFSSHSGGCFLGTDVAAAGLATRRRLLEVAFGWIGGSVPALVFAAEGTAVGAAVRFFVRPRADANGCFFVRSLAEFGIPTRNLHATFFGGCFSADGRCFRCRRCWCRRRELFLGSVEVK